MQRCFYERGRDAIAMSDHQELKNLYIDAQHIDYEINIADIFLKLFYSACKHNRKGSIIFLFECYFDMFTEAERIALRQSFFYGKYQIKNKQLTHWYNECVLPIIRCY